MLLAIPSIAEAAWGQATGSVNMRACASTSCAKIGVVPAGAPVWVGGAQGGWYDGRRWYRNGTWYNQPSGITFGFSFGG